LAIPSSKQQLRRWLGGNERRLVAVLATRIEPQLAKSLAAEIRIPTSCEFLLDPPLEYVLQSVAGLLESQGFATAGAALAQQDGKELARLGGFASTDALDQWVLQIYDPEEQRRFLRERSAKWSAELRLFAVVARTTRVDTRATIRQHDTTVAALLGPPPARPSELLNRLDALFPAAQELVNDLGSRLTDDISADAPSREQVTKLAEQHGIDVSLFDAVRRALDAPRRQRVERTARQMEQLAERQLAPTIPPTLKPDDPPSGKEVKTKGKTVRTIRVDATHDQRKRRAGAEGEEWAVASIVAGLIDLDVRERRSAIEALSSFLGNQFDGDPVERAISHGDLALDPSLDEDELIDALIGFLHVAQHSDGFGFDLLGWLPPSPGSAPQPMCLEVKSAATPSFHLSTGEWERAKQLQDAGIGDHYAVLVVRREAGGSAPAGMDLLVNPIDLVAAGRLTRTADGYEIRYRAGTT
jgi:hypothetical protein